MEASIAPSIRWKATRLPPESATATFIFQFRVFASATAASIAAWARSSEIGGPYGVSKGILSGTKSRGLVSAGCSARLALAALPVLSFDICPPTVATASFVVTWITSKKLKMHFFFVAAASEERFAGSTMDHNSVWLPRSARPPNSNDKQRKAHQIPPSSHYVIR